MSTFRAFAIFSILHRVIFFFGTFYHAYIRPMNACQICKLLLRKFVLFSEFLNSLTKSQQDWFFIHYVNVGFLGYKNRYANYSYQHTIVSIITIFLTESLKRM